VPQFLPPAVHALIQAQSPLGASLPPELCAAEKIITLNNYVNPETAYYLPPNSNSVLFVFVNL
jgi:hypothetical protein